MRRKESFIYKTKNRQFSTLASCIITSSNRRKSIKSEVSKSYFGVWKILGKGIRMIKKLCFYLVFFIITFVFSQISFYLSLLILLPSTDGIMATNITIFTKILLVLGLILVFGFYIFSLFKLIQKNIDAGIIITNIFLFIVFFINSPAILPFFF